MRSLVLLFGLLPCSASRLVAQAAISGVVKEDSSRTAVAGVEVVIEALNRKWTTDSSGRVLMTGLGHGLHTILIRSIGYQPIRLRAYLVTNDTLYVDLRIRKAVVELAPLEVTASSIPPGLDAFEERRLDGLGKFVDWTVLRKSEHRRLSDLLRETQGVRIRYDQDGVPYVASSRDNCPMQVYLNGISIYKPMNGGDVTPPPSIDFWKPGDLDGIEIYRGPAETPAMYGGHGGTCGTLLLWTRRR